LVVKNGSKTRELISSGMPVPVSAMATTTRVFSTASLMLAGAISVVGECANSRIALTDRRDTAEALGGPLEGLRDELLQVLEVRELLGNDRTILARAPEGVG
jgi:hypothetical protein